MSSNKRKTEEMHDKYSKKMLGLESKLDLSSALMNSLYKVHELIMN